MGGVREFCVVANPPRIAMVLTYENALEANKLFAEVFQLKISRKNAMEAYIAMKCDCQSMRSGGVHQAQCLLVAYHVTWPIFAWVNIRFGLTTRSHSDVTHTQSY